MMTPCNLDIRNDPHRSCWLVADNNLDCVDASNPSILMLKKPRNRMAKAAQRPFNVAIRLLRHPQSHAKPYCSFTPTPELAAKSP